MCRLSKGSSYLRFVQFSTIRVLVLSLLGDERPCQRCIKRGLQDACHDGTRKKAKYLHDAPNEALLPGAADTYKQKNGVKTDSKLRKKSSSDVDVVPTSSSLIPSSQAASFPSFHPDLPQRQMSQSMQHETSVFSSYDPQQSTISGQFSPQGSAMEDILATMQRTPPSNSGLDQQLTGTIMDSGDPVLFNFDTSRMNFGNHYGALEFGMLGHMSLGANDTLTHGNQGGFDASNHAPSGFMEELEDVSSYGLTRMNSNPEWQLAQAGQALPMHMYNAGLGNADALRRSSCQRPLAYAIGAGPSPGFSGASPASTALDLQGNFEGNFMDPLVFNRQPQQQVTFRNPPGLRRRQHSQSEHDQETTPSEVISKKLHQLPPGASDTKKRLKSASAVYEAVTQPYPYTQGFHALTAMLQRRFASQKRLAIAQAMASIRPSFISCTRNLVDDDLLFMEKCFQRQLYEYQDFVNACGSPTIVCRRTGEVALVGKEFSLLTGWSKDVLLGKEPNLNCNQQANAGVSGGSRSGINTPRVPIGATEPERAEATTLGLSRPQAVFLAELLDDDSVVQFYEDFAKLAFADSKGSVWSPCKLLKYKAPEGNTLPFGGLGTANADANGRVRRTNGGMISSEEGMTKLGDKDGKVDCVYCWMVRRDVFDIPMMIVLNVSLLLCSSQVQSGLLICFSQTVFTGHMRLFVQLTRTAQTRRPRCHFVHQALD